MESIIIQATPFLRFFIESIDPENWRDIAFAWVQHSILVGISAGMFYLGLKLFLKRTAPNLNRAVWTRFQTWQTFTLGLVPSFLVLGIFWFLNSDFQSFIQALGLLKGALLMAFSYLIIVFVFHIATPWRREII
jgi:hypothetical protein